MGISRTINDTFNYWFWSSSFKKESVNENVWMPNSTMLNLKENILIRNLIQNDSAMLINRDDNIKMRYLWFSESFMTDHENV